MKLALRNLLKSDSLPSAFRRFVQQLFSDQRPNPEVDIIESNLRYVLIFNFHLLWCASTRTLYKDNMDKMWP
jgi:hypothetical protein